MEELLKKAMAGDKTALESIITQHQDMIYNLALRMLWHPEDAKDATQEILIRLITNLGKFSFRSSFKTWLYRLATNHLINYKQKHFRYPLTFELHENFLQSGLAEDISYSQEEGVRKLLVQEAKIGCSNAMLQCLDASQRAVYILGEILELNSQEGAEILEISPENFRQKLSRSRKKMDRHTRRNCGLVNPENALVHAPMAAAGI
ncbi:MAG: RNA polymerase sigma factor, partial [Bacteroidota bacterium]